MDLTVHQNQPKSPRELLLKCRFLGASSRDSDSVGLGYRPKMYIFNTQLGQLNTNLTTL